MKVVVIDDDLFDEDELEVIGEEHELKNFWNPDEGLRYICKHLDEKMLVFISWYFGGKRRGIDVLHDIREKSPSVNVVMLAPGFALFDYPSTTLIELMNDKNLLWFNDDTVSVDSMIQTIEDFSKEENT